MHPIELAAQRQVTRDFIAADPTLISLTPYAYTRTPSGGRSWMPQTPRPPQVFRLIPTSHTEEPRVGASAAVGADGGVQRAHQFTLLGAWDAQVGVHDRWVDVDGVYWEVIGLVTPMNRYEIKALVDRYTELNP